MSEHILGKKPKSWTHPLKTGVITFRIWNTLSAVTFEPFKQSTSLYLSYAIFGIKFYQNLQFLEKMATNYFFDPTFLGRANKNDSFWLKILKFGKNYLKALT